MAETGALRRVPWRRPVRQRMLPWGRQWLVVVSGCAAILASLVQPGMVARSQQDGPLDPTGSCAAASVGEGTSAGSWQPAPLLPEPRAEATAAALGDRIFVAGGIQMSGSGGDTRVATLDSILSLGPADPAWVTGWSLPAPRDHLAMVAWEGSLFVAGGTRTDESMARRTIWRGDPVDGSWYRLSQMPDIRYGHAMVVLDGTLYLMGGISGRRTDPRSVWAYDIAGDTWRTDLAFMPTPRDHLGLVVVGGRIVAIGGLGQTDLATVEIYDPATDTWTAGPPMPTPRSAIAVALLDDGVHVVGGQDYFSLASLAAHEVLDPTLTTWSCRADLPMARQSIASAVTAGRWILAGGGPSGVYSTSDLVDAWVPIDPPSVSLPVAAGPPTG